MHLLYSQQLHPKRIPCLIKQNIHIIGFKYLGHVKMYLKHMNACLIHNTCLLEIRRQGESDEWKDQEMLIVLIYIMVLMLYTIDMIILVN